MFVGMWTRESLAAHVAGGKTLEFFFFWGHTPKAAGVVDRSCLSQWFPAAFEVAGISYATAEHFMMAEKARLFRDDAALAKVLAAATPADAKAIGRTVKDYADDAWGRARLDAVVRGNVAKFGQNEAMGRFLRDTGDQVLVEAAPRDTIWGIGMGAANPNASHPARWRGRNLLGFALMETRARLAARGAWT